MRAAIANTLATVRAQELAQECFDFGLEPERDDEDSPWSGKWRYVDRRLRRLDLPELLELVGKVQGVYESAELAHLLGLAARGGAGELRTLTGRSRQLMRRQELTTYLDRCSEDDPIEQVLLPLFRQLGFHRITAAGHKDKALEYGKDVWMRYTLPTQHILYFGLQAKKGKIDSSGVTKPGNGQRCRNPPSSPDDALPTRSSIQRPTGVCWSTTHSSWWGERSPSRRGTG